MTGFGQAKIETEEFVISVEIKSVNHRFASFSIRIPWNSLALEKRLEDILSEKIKRGRVNCIVSFERTGKESLDSIDLDLELAKSYYTSYIKLKEYLKIEDDELIRHVSTFPGIIRLKDKKELDEALMKYVERAFSDALSLLIEERKREGEGLANGIFSIVSQLEDILSKIEEKKDVFLQEYKERLKKRIEKLTDTSSIDAERIEEEIAIYAEKSDITEELLRLSVHIDHLKELLNEDKPVGRRLDFLIQEMNREVNTIGAKSPNFEISHMVVDMKSNLEKIREQIQNLE